MRSCLSTASGALGSCCTATSRWLRLRRISGCSPASRWALRERRVHHPVHDRAKAPPVGPVAADVRRMRAGDALEPFGDLDEPGGVDLDELLDPLGLVLNAEGPARLVEEERECVKERRAWLGRTVGHVGEKPAAGG